ncbi:MAG: di-trans,poly-cis-decaprenylcistransferase [Betaproteobacteria bacterium]|jgi:undecaprenyl diphosphate synthase|nr:di-trans,poly-cis-decaprenylcistransferase [Betaproteobacteria bacterium]
MLPHHVAIVMDGNGRWAKQRLLPRIAGHKRGVDALREVVRHCVVRGVRVLTVFAFSSENWQRSPEEVSGLMDLLVAAISRETPALANQGVQLHFVGDRDGLSPAIRKCMAEAQAATAGNDRLLLNVCVNYGGRWDIAQAARALAESGQAITEESLSHHMGLAHCGDPDLLIRTGAEKRLSNFLLWQAAYAELYFSDRLWPDFDAACLDAALLEFGRRERRFGRVPEPSDAAALQQKVA